MLNRHLNFDLKVFLKNPTFLGLVFGKSEEIYQTNELTFITAWLKNRSYYRCSSSKGCPARKQVERSSSDPLVFIISYTAEHSHGLPVRRNSLAGIAKKKSSTMKINPSTSDPETPTLKDSSCCSPISSTTALSPTSPLMACLEDEFPQHESTKRERMEEEEHMIKLDSMMSNSVLFSGYEGLDGLTSDLSAFECWFSDQIPATFQS